MIDLTNIGGHAAQQKQGSSHVPTTPVVSHTEDDGSIPEMSQGGSPTEKVWLDKDTVIINGRQVKVRSNTSRQQIEEETWTPNKFEKDHQFKAGDVDAGHTKFLQNTEMIPDDVGA